MFWRRYNTFGSFSVPYGSKIAAVKLVHPSGYVTCDKRIFSYWSFWGCGKRPAVKYRVGVVITTISGVIITPERPFLKKDPGKFSELPRYKSFSPWCSRAKGCDCGMVRIWWVTLKATMEDRSVRVRKWSQDRKWSRTANDPQIEPQMIPDRKWSPYWTANDPDQKIRNGMDLYQRKVRTCTKIMN